MSKKGDKSDRTEKLYTRLTRADMLDLKRWAVEHDLSVPDAAEEAVRALVAPEVQQDKPDGSLVLTHQQKNVRKNINEVTIPLVLPEGEPVVPQGETWYEHREIHRKLERILKEGPPGMAADITGNIDWFTVALDALGGQGDTANRVPGERPDLDDPEAGLREIESLEHEHRKGTGDTRKDDGRKGPRKKKSG